VYVVSYVRVEGTEVAVEDDVVVVLEELLDVVDDEAEEVDVITDELEVVEPVVEAELEEETIVVGVVLCEEEELWVVETVELVRESVTATPPITIMITTITTTATAATLENAFL